MDGRNKIPETAYGVLLPGDENTEQTVLGTLIRRNELFAHVDDILSPEAFKNEVWDNLNEDNKISLYVRMTDLETGIANSTILNKLF